MIWPWSEIRKWKRLAEHYELFAAQRGHAAELARAEYRGLLLTMIGAHKGIWRLKQKLKKYEKERL